MHLADGLRLAPAVLGSRLGILAPYKLLLSLTDRCNQRCAHCRTWTTTPGPELTPEEIGRSLRSLPSLRWVDLTGGEIFLRRDLDMVFDAVVESVHPLLFLHFPTNGSAPDRILAGTHRLRGRTSARIVVTVSVDGDEALHDRLRGTPGAFERAMETLRSLDALSGVDVFVGTTVTPENAHALPSIRGALDRHVPGLRSDQWHLNVMTRSPHFFRNTGIPALSSEQVLALIPQLEELRGRPRDAFAQVERFYLRGLRRFHRRGTPPAPCQALRASLFVHADGDVYGCHILDHRLGNLRSADFDLAGVLRSPPAAAERRRIARAPCAACWTPCEAYHAMLAGPLRTVLRGLRP